MKKVFEKVVTKAAAALIVAALAAGLTACGGSDKTEQAAAQEETAVEESASAQSTVFEQINPEQINPEQIDPETHEAVQKESEEEPAAAEQTAEVIQKPEPAEEPVQEQEEPAPVQDEEKKEEKKEEEKVSSSDKELAILDEGISFDGMDLDFPIDPDNMKIGNWQITYRDVDDPSATTVVPGQVVLADMTNPDYAAENVIVSAEFGNYTDSDLSLADMPITGIYIQMYPAGEGTEVKIPAVTLPGGITWGSTETDVYEALGEASFSSYPDDGFDFMYENGKFLMEVAGKKETGVDYIVFSME